MEAIYIRARIVAHFKKKGELTSIAYKTLGCEWAEGFAAFKSLCDDGTLESFVRTTPKGRKSRVYRLRETVTPVTAPAEPAK